MIADIEFRWVKTTEKHRTKMAEHGWYVDYVTANTLQFRKIREVVSVEWDAEEGLMANAAEEVWTDWQDVPVVEE